jgi:hypothetical protein
MMGLRAVLPWWHGGMVALPQEKRPEKTQVAQNSIFRCLLGPQPNKSLGQQLLYQ